MRIGGRWLTWNQKPKPIEGTLLSSRKTAEDRTMTVLFISGLESENAPQLYDPKFVSVLGDEMRIVGLEKFEQAWVLQEWKCEILSLRS